MIKVEKKEVIDIFRRIKEMLKMRRVNRNVLFLLGFLFVLSAIFIGSRNNSASDTASENNIDEVLAGGVIEVNNTQEEKPTEDLSLSRVSIGLGLSDILSFLKIDESVVTGHKSAIIKVPSEVDSIQKAIDGAESGDVVLVSAGEYKGTIIMKDGVSLIGEDAETTILDGNEFGNVVTFKEIKNTETRFENFTVRNAKENLSGILIENSSPLVNRNIVLQNDYDIYVKGESSPAIQHNKLSESKAGVQIFNLSEVENSNPFIVDNLIFGNKKGINIYKGNAIIEHNTISFNSAYGIEAGATFGIYLTEATAGIRNNVITDNGVCEICGGIYIDAKSEGVIIDHNDIWNNQNNFVCFGGCTMEDNNLSEDPMFENGLLFEFNLKAESPFLVSGSDGQKLGARL